MVRSLSAKRSLCAKCVKGVEMRVAILALMVATGAAQSQAQLILNDYPTEARADYVFACMAANGQTREMLSRCSCSVDIIVTILPYDDYVAAETVLSLRQTAGERMAIFRTAEPAKGAVANLRRAQAEAEIRCF